MAMAGGRVRDFAGARWDGGGAAALAEQADPHLVPGLAVGAGALPPGRRVPVRLEGAARRRCSGWVGWPTSTSSCFVLPVGTVLTWPTVGRWGDESARPGL